MRTMPAIGRCFAAKRSESDYYYVQGLTDVLVKLSDRMESPVWMILSKIKEKELLQYFYDLAKPDSGLTQRQVINRMKKALA